MAIINLNWDVFVVRVFQSSNRGIRCRARTRKKNKETPEGLN